jgi:Mycobacterium membrane protein
VVEPGVRDVRVAETWPDVAMPDLPDLNQWSGPGLAVPWDRQQTTRAPSADRKSRPHRRLVLFGVVRRVWIPLLISVVIGAGSLTVSRLHGVFGSEQRPLYADAQSNDTTRFDPKQLTFEIFGPPGTLATISYFDADADPQRVTNARLPWSLTFATTPATSVESIAAQGDSDSIGCRILLDGVVKAEHTSHEVGAFISCRPKDE